LDRDHNAALNILQKALDGTLGHRETTEPLSSENAWGEVTATVLPEVGVQQVSSPNQEPPVL
ncbi:MAG: RNA-guided endonuclease TnpB family protein, partial [Ktedonobacteraceae bacterium]